MSASSASRESVVAATNLPRDTRSAGRQSLLSARSVQLGGAQAPATSYEDSQQQLPQNSNEPIIQQARILAQQMVAQDWSAEKATEYAQNQYRSSLARTSDGSGKQRADSGVSQSMSRAEDVHASQQYPMRVTPTAYSSSQQTPSQWSQLTPQQSAQLPTQRAAQQNTQGLGGGQQARPYPQPQIQPQSQPFSPTQAQTQAQALAQNQMRIQEACITHLVSRRYTRQ